MAQLGAEPSSVSVTRLICQLVLSLVVMAGGVLLLLTHPEYNGGIAMAIGMVLGAWFGVVLRR